MIYIISSTDYATINANMPSGHTFGYIQNDLFLFDDFVVRFYPFDINITLQESLGVDYETYIAGLQKLESLHCKIYRYVPEEAMVKFNKLEAPVDLDYKTGLTRRLHPKHTFFKGELRKTEYFSDVQLTDKIVTVEMVYTRNSIGFALSRTVSRKWVMENGEFHPTVKTTTKDYSLNVIDQIKEGIYRRENIINNLQTPCLAFMIASMPDKTQTEIILIGREFMDKCEDSMQKFIKNSSTITDPASPDVGKKTLWVFFRDASETWLDLYPPQLGGTMTIRQYLMNEVDI